MQVTPTLNEGLKRAFTVVVPSADLQARRDARLAEVAKTIKLPGFRPGKVPASLVKQRYGASVNAELLEEAVNDATTKLFEEQKIRPAMQPKVEVVSAIEDGKDLEFKVETEVLPEIEVPDLSGLKLTRLGAKVSEETVEKALNDVARRSRKFETIEEDRAAAQGDVVCVDFVGKLDGTPFDGGTADDVNVEIGGEGFIPGFAEQMEGMKAGEERVINVTFPADYQAEELAGKAVTFDIKAKSLKKAVDPVIDDELAKTIGFENLEQIRKIITEQAEGEYQQLSRLRIKRDLLDALSEKTDFEAPSSMVDAEFNQIWARVEEDRKAGRLDEEDAGKDEETLKADYRRIAERRVKLGLLLAEIGRKQEIQVSREELLGAMQQEAQRYPGQEQMVFEFFSKNPQAVEGLRGPILENKVVDYLIELADVTDKDVTPEELAEIPPAEL
ncbi:trigger factor [Gluconobacter kanchanaburiensis]|uniref:Trigger factor n=1 Tax=Gluconobacter kanchanaburiensis NBRC 103587 TaxID=1307948 RepID=A0A511B8N5_9PROT|nr:trigger factor [Gluconobacter kanchanaburiensis]MBF0861142.1 trigger factor [Gluconobacter kanchanaburiensis]GEK96042.1 trigger factor [Gluconobacter kanchanaburiensis NBRC 103587]